MHRLYTALIAGAFAAGLLAGFTNAQKPPAANPDGPPTAADPRLVVELFAKSPDIVHPVATDFDAKGPAIVMLNGMGGSPLIELYLMYGEVAKLLEKAGVQVARTLVGNYITSLDMAGCSVTVLKADDELLKLWDAPVSTAGLRWGL